MSDGRGLKFGSVADLYDAYRPTPPPEAAELFGDLSGQKVLEVGAGTGIWSRFLLQRGAQLTIVEPDRAMRAVLERRSPEVVSLEGTAERVPVDDASFDLVLASSAWHWFTQPDATLEMGRVLRDGGKLFVLWNGFSRDVGWLKELTELRENPGDTNARPRGWTVSFENDELFREAVNLEIHWTWTRTPDELLAVFGTYSGTIMKTEEQRRATDLELGRRIKNVTQAGVVQVPMTLRGTIATRSARHV